MANPIPSSEEFDLDWLATEMHEWKGIQEMINESQQREDDRVIHHTWLSDIPFLHLYHTLVDDSIRAAFGKAYAAKTREELDGRNSLLFHYQYKSYVVCISIVQEHLCGGLADVNSVGISESPINL